MNKRLFSWLLISAFLVSNFCLIGCGKSEIVEEPIPAVVETTVPETPDPVEVLEETAPVLTAYESLLAAHADNVTQLSDTQRNSVAMLNYLTVLATEINQKRDSEDESSKMYLEEVYSSLISNTYPNAVDYTTQHHLSDLLDILEDYRLLDVKRERLEYMYEQNQAAAIRSAIPNPLGLLSAVQSGNILKFLASATYMAIDSVSSYKGAKNDAEIEYLKGGWDLDDQEADVLHQNRKQAFMYMLDVVRNNQLPGELALSEEAVNELVEWERRDNASQIIQFLESNCSTYEAYGNYWLILADKYYDINEYEKCLDALATYECVQTKIFRKDINLAELMPKAILSAQEIYEESDYVFAVEHFLQLITDNIGNEDWALRYFAVQAYIDLYAREPKPEYLQKAYEMTVDNVNLLVKEQQEMNAKYLEDVYQVSITDTMSKEEKDEAKKYNKLLNDGRKTELPPVSEALKLNCSLLFALADHLNITEKEQTRITNLIHNKGEALFLNSTIDSLFTFGEKNIEIKNITLTKNTIKIPVEYITEDAHVSTKISGTSGEKLLDDWKLEKVERGTKGDFSTFYAVYSSNEAKKYKYSSGEKVLVEIYPEETDSWQSITCGFDVNVGKTAYVLNKIDFIRNDA